MAADPIKLLVVEDDEALRMVLETRLGGWGYEVLLAADGAEGRQMSESEDPALVLSDVVLPDISGLELLRSLKGGNPSRPVVLMTAQGDRKSVV